MLIMIVSTLFALLMLTHLRNVRYNRENTLQIDEKDFTKLSEFEILLALDNYVIGYNSKLEGTNTLVMADKGQYICNLYWCDILRLYAFSAEDEGFHAFLNGLDGQQWSDIINAYNSLKLASIKEVAVELSEAAGQVGIEQSEHLRYSIRDVNEELQHTLCSYIRKNACVKLHDV